MGYLFFVFFVIVVVDCVRVWVVSVFVGVSFVVLGSVVNNNLGVVIDNNVNIVLDCMVDEFVRMSGLKFDLFFFLLLLFWYDGLGSYFVR